MAKRSSKTVEQQCRYYEVDNIFVYMVETYINGNISVFRELYRELNKDARKDFMDFLLSEVEPTYCRGILKQTIENDSDMNKTTEKIPTWSLCYLTGGDRAGLTEEEVRLIDKWTSDWQVQIVSPLTDMDGNAQPYFSYYPLFGLPAEVEDCDILYLNDNPAKI